MSSAGVGARTDVGIITVREDEFRAVLDALPDAIDTASGGRFYERRWLECHDRRRYIVAVARASEQGNTAAQAVANDLLHDLAPRWVLMVGIAGGRASDEFSLGDVVVSTRIVDHSVGAALPGGVAEFAHGGGPLLPEAERVVANLPARDRELAAWGATIPLPRPAQHDRAPRVVTGAILSSDLLMRDPERLRSWLVSARQVLACEMESAGAYRATHARGVPFVAIRGISDIVGVPRDPAWTRYAAASAAAFARAFLRTGPIPSENPVSAPQPSRENVSPRHTSPAPFYPDEATRSLCDKIAEARERRRKLVQVGANIAELDQEIRELRRNLREGGQLRAGDALDDGRYLLIRRLGRGGFAVVWEAHDEHCGTRVAIKVLHGDLAGDIIRKERFFRGARIMAELAGDAIVRILQPHGEEGGFFYFVMDLVSGGDLRQAVLDGRSTGDAWLDMIARVGDALARAHQKGFVHRDVKPANILLDARGEPLLTDFDLVGGVDTTGGTRTGAMGSWIYAAPELMQRPQDADARADVYGLGMTAVFGLYGAELPMEVLRGAESIIGTLACNAAVKNVLRRAVDWNPAVRFADAAAFCAALREARTAIAATVAGSPAPLLESTVTGFLVVIQHPDISLLGHRWILREDLNETSLDVDRGTSSPLRFRVERRGDRFFLWNVDPTRGTWVNEDRLDEDTGRELCAGDRIRIGDVICRFFGGNDGLGARSKTLFHDGPTDELTGLTSRARVMELLEQVIAAAARDDRTMSGLSIHVDQMDRIDDDESEPIGDRVLKELADILQSSLRPGDIVGRLGGASFLVVLPDADADPERIHAAVRSHEWRAEGEILGITVSIGLVYNPGWLDTRYSAADLVREARGYAGRVRVYGGNGDYGGADTLLCFSVKSVDEVVRGGFFLDGRPERGSLTLFGIGDEQAVMRLGAKTMDLWTLQLVYLVRDPKPKRGELKALLCKDEYLFRGHPFLLHSMTEAQLDEFIDMLRERWASFPVPLLHQRTISRTLRWATLSPDEVREHGERSFDVLWARLQGEAAPRRIESISQITLHVLRSGEEQETGRSWVLEKAITYLGRSSAAEIRLQDRNVSKRHAVIELVDGTLSLWDDGSSNGTSCNGRLVGARSKGSKKARLEDGDVIKLGDTLELLVRISPPPSL